MNYNSFTPLYSPFPISSNFQNIKHQKVSHFSYKLYLIPFNCILMSLLVRSYCITVQISTKVESISFFLGSVNSIFMDSVILTGYIILPDCVCKVPPFVLFCYLSPLYHSPDYSLEQYLKQSRESLIVLRVQPDAVVLLKVSSD